VIVVIAVISILAAMAVPYAVKILDQSREEATKKQMEEIHRAIMGDPKVPTAGYLGDMGRLPVPPPPPVAALTNLNTQGTQAGPTTGTLGVKYGWYGPYVKIGYSAGAYLVDGWGTPLVYNSPGAGQITSYGPNRVVGGGDDITFPSYPSLTPIPSGRLQVNLYIWDNTNYVLNPSHLVAPTTVRQYYAVNGGRLLTTLGTPADPPYTFPPVHAGFHEVEAIIPPDLITVRGRAVVYIPENNQAVLNLYLR
jgi:type II secretory pathway pseudopilin PulG